LGWLPPNKFVVGPKEDYLMETQLAKLINLIRCIIRPISQSEMVYFVKEYLGQLKVEFVPAETIDLLIMKRSLPIFVNIAGLNSLTLGFEDTEWDIFN
jgi:hypothetical protein